MSCNCEISPNIVNIMVIHHYADCWPFSVFFSGGQSSLADYCTYFVAYSDGSCTDTNSARAPDRMLGEVRGISSR